MTTPTLSGVTTDVIHAYGETARNLVKATRVGSQRLVGFVDQGVERAVRPLGARLSPALRANLVSTRQRVNDTTRKGIELTTGGAETVVHTAVDLAANGVKRLAAGAQSLDQMLGTHALDQLSLAVLPGAVALHGVVGRFEQGSARLVTRIAGDGVVVKAAKAARRQVAKAAPAVRRGVRKVSKAASAR
jgi:hypothetical protein